MTKKFAFTLSGETRVYLLGTASNPASAASAAATKVAGEPIVYAECDSRDAEIEAYIVADGFDGATVGEDLDPEYWLAVDREATAIAKLVAAVRNLTHRISVDAETGAFVLELEGREVIEYHGGTDWTFFDAQGRRAEIQYDLSQMDGVGKDLARYIEVLAANPAGEADDVAELGRDQLAERDAA